jgi:hypothetical protein
MKILRKLFAFVLVCSVGVSCTPYVVVSNNDLAAEERIVYSESFKIFSIRPDGSAKKIIDDDAGDFSISPDGKRMMVFSAKNMKTESLDARLYDLQDGSFTTVVFPEGFWAFFDSWWTDDSEIICLYSYFDDYGRPLYSGIHFTLLDSPVKVVGMVSYNIRTGKFNVYDYKDNPRIFRDFLKDNHPPIKKEFFSPNKEYLLRWITWDKNAILFPQSLLAELYLVSAKTSKNKLVYKKEFDKFGNSAYVTEFPWSPDSKRFVLDFYQAGFWKAVLAINEPDIYVIRADSLKWEKIAHGRKPFWFKKLPLEFHRQSNAANHSATLRR